MIVGLVAWVVVGLVFAAINRRAHVPGVRTAWWEWAIVILFWPVALVWWVGMLYVSLMVRRR